MYYILDENHNPVKVEDFNQWAAQMGTIKRVAIDEIDGTTVSTVFLGLDHNFGGGQPILFETMAFSDNLDYNDYQYRYCTWNDAVEGHKKVCEKVRNKIPLNERRTFKLNFKCED